MTPKQKAIELVEKYRKIKLGIDAEEKPVYLVDWNNDAIDCAIIAVDEIIKQWEYIDLYIADLGGELNPNLRYWQQVKHELENLK